MRRRTRGYGDTGDTAARVVGRAEARGQAAPEEPRRSPRVALELLGLGIALFYVVGRWGPHRLFMPVGSGDGSVRYTELRWWIALGVLGLFLVLRRSGARDAPVPTEDDRALKLVGRLVMAFLLFMLLSALWCPNFDLAWHKAQQVGLLTGITYLFYRALLVTDREKLNIALWRNIVLMTGFLAVVGVLSVSGMMGERMAVLGGGPNVFGRNMGMLWLGALFIGHRSRRKWLWISVGVVGGMLSVTSGSRGATIASLVALLICLTYLRIALVRKIQLAMVVAVVSVALLQSTRLGESTLRVFDQRVVSLSFEHGYTSGRIPMMQDAFAIGMDHFVVGSGLHGFAVHTHGMVRRYPHNVFLEAFSEGGIIALGLLSATFLVPLVLVLRGRLQFQGADLGAVFLLLASAQFSGDFYDSRGYFIFLLAAVATARASPQRAPHAAPLARRRLPPRPPRRRAA